MRLQITDGKNFLSFCHVYNKTRRDANPEIEFSSTHYDPAILYIDKDVHIDLVKLYRLCYNLNRGRIYSTYRSFKGRE